MASQSISYRRTDGFALGRRIASLGLRELTLIPAIVLAIVAGSLVSDAFLTADNLLNITNHSEGKSDYYIEATILDKDGTKVGTANTYVTGVEGGQKAKDKLIGTVTGGGKDVTVKITTVQRTAS